MSERKVINKYYPPDYDPSKVPRIKRKTRQKDVRIMAPFNMRCSTCGNYIANATKFNAKKETVEDETYNNLLIFRFYIKCPRCMATIIFRTNPKEQAYEVEHGATENFMALKVAERQARDEAEAAEEEEKIDPMKQLENRTKASRQQMEASDQIQSLRSMKHRMHSVDIDSIIHTKRQEIAQETNSLAITDGRQEDDIRAEARALLKMKKHHSVEPEAGSSQGHSDNTSRGFKRPVTSGDQASVGLHAPKPGASKKPSISVALLKLKKKIKVDPK